MVRIYKLDNYGDERGFNFKFPDSVFPFIGNISYAHASSVIPGTIRGNHYHVDKKEILLILNSDNCTIGWDTGDGTEIQKAEYQEEAAVLLEIEPGSSHAIKNTGNKLVTIFAFSNKRFDPESPDTHRRVVLE
jgi:UDP-2-acetamido-2,6-beta-L-arabino-hexul-4-ose reductase